MLHTLHYGHANASHTCLLIKIVVVVVFCRYVCGGRLSNSSLVRRALHNPPKINTQFLSFTFEKQKIYLFTFIQSTSQAAHTHTLLLRIRFCASHKTIITVILSSSQKSLELGR